MGLRHASDPDHLIAVTSLVASEDGGARSAARVGAWWGLGHAAMLVGLGIPLIAFKSELPAWLESGAELAIGVVIVALALRVLRRSAHPADRHDRVRTPREAFGIGLLHGLAGTGAVVVLLLAALPTQLEAALALAVFAPASILSMTACTTAFAWVLTRPVVAPAYRGVVIPSVGLLGAMLGVWYIGLV